MKHALVDKSVRAYRPALNTPYNVESIARVLLPGSTREQTNKHFVRYPAEQRALREIG